MIASPWAKLSSTIKVSMSPCHLSLHGRLGLGWGQPDNPRHRVWSAESIQWQSASAGWHAHDAIPREQPLPSPKWAGSWAIRDGVDGLAQAFLPRTSFVEQNVGGARSSEVGASDSLDVSDWPHPAHGSTAAPGPTLVPSQPFPFRCTVPEWWQSFETQPSPATAALNVMVRDFCAAHRTKKKLTINVQDVTRYAKMSMLLSIT